MPLKKVASKPRPTSGSTPEGMEKTPPATPPVTHSPQTTQSMPERTPTQTQPETAVNPSQIVEEILNDLQATNEETINGEGDSDNHTQAVPPVSPLIEFDLISPPIGILIDI